MTKSLIESTGAFVQAFSDDCVVPQALMTAGRSVVSSAPDNAADTWNGTAWVPAVAPLIVQRKAEVDALLLQKCTAGAAITGVPSAVQLRDGDRANVGGAVTQALISQSNSQVPWPATFAWRLADNSSFPLATAAAMITFGAQVAAKYLAMRQAAWKHKDALAALTDPVQIAAYDITVGWP